MSLLKRLEVPHEGGTIPDPWINNDIKPVEAGRRKWGFWTFNYYWNILASVFIVLNSLPGAFYHLGFPVANRYVWGMWGSQWVICNRIFLSISKFSISTPLPSRSYADSVHKSGAIWPSLEDRIPNHMPASTGMTTAEFVAYIVFMVISLPFVYVRPHKLQLLFYISAAVVLVFEVVLLIWSLATMGDVGFGDTISSTTSSSGWMIAYGIISTIGSIAAGILNQTDYARFARKPRDAIYGQIISSALCAISCGVIGILVTAATQNRYGEAMWNLPNLLSAIIETGGSRSRAAAFFGGVALVVSQIGVNVPGNALSGGFDFAATWPKYINIRRGAYLTVLISIAANPWKLVNTATTFLTVLSSYSVFVGPMVGLMISSYLVVNQRKIKVPDLFIGNKNSIYWYTYGVNWRAVVAFTDIAYSGSVELPLLSPASLRT
uniref:Allantoin permease n=1 Tax=Talaromyces marneffei PM1 TaxID=1077442 RepID=A0A093VJ29_TALMA